MDSTLISTRPDEGTLSLSRARRAALGSFAGAVVDWYDFLLYGITAALVFNREFFPQVSPAMGTLAAFATFGVGFLFRPLGGVIFGHFGDRLGRKRMLMLTVWMMGIATALIGILPSFSTIGWWAPILLVNRPGFPGECFICELRLPDHRFRWKHNKLFLLLPEEYGPAFPAIVDYYTSPPT